MTKEEIINEIRRLFDKDKGNTLNKVLKENKEIDDFLQDMIDNEPWFESKRRAFSCVARGIFHKVKCHTCGKDIQLMKALYGRIYCDSKCGSNNKEAMERRKKTNMERYGAENPFASDKIKKKIRETNIEKYGIDNPSKNEQIKKKIKSVMMDRYGVESPLQNSEIQEKFKNTMLQRYGVDSPLRSEEIKQRAVQTNLQRFGCEWGFQNEEVKKKSKETCLEKYGVKNIVQCEEIRNKIIHTNLSRYNVKFPLQSSEIRQKGVETTFERYGCKCSLQNEEVRNKAKEACIEKYGVENPSMCEEIRRRVKKTNFERYGYEENAQCPELIARRIETVHNKTYERMLSELSNDVIPMFTREEYVGLSCSNHSVEYEWKCVHCGKTFKHSISRITHAPRCPFCGRVFSTGEQNIIDLIKEHYSGEIVMHTRKILPNRRELDIYLPDRKIAIEYNGLYWHSVENGKDMDYHVTKSIECENLGIHLIHVFENEWKCNRDLISSFIVDAIRFDDKSLLFRNHFGLCRNDGNEIFVSRSYFNEKILNECECKILKIVEPMLHMFSIKNGKMLECSEKLLEKYECMTFYDCGGFIIEPPHPPVDQIWSLN